MWPPPMITASSMSALVPLRSPLGKGLPARAFGAHNPFCRKAIRHESVQRPAFPQYRSWFRIGGAGDRRQCRNTKKTTTKKKQHTTNTDRQNQATTNQPTSATEE